MGTMSNVPATVNSTTDEDSYAGVPGHRTPMHPGHDNRARFSPRTAAKHQAPPQPAANYPGGMGGMSDLGNGTPDC